MTYMGKPYYPLWLDNLADDVTGEGPAWDGTIQGAQAVHEVVARRTRNISSFKTFITPVLAPKAASLRIIRPRSAACRCASSCWSTSTPPVRLAGSS